MIKLIAIVDEDFGISKNDEIPWSFPEDRRFFHEKTKDSIVVMGKNTFFSLGSVPLKERINCVVSKTLESVDRIQKFNSLEDVVEKYRNSNDLWIIGGAKLYNYALKECLVEYAIIVQVHKKYNADTFLNKQAFEKFSKKNLFQSCGYSIFEFIHIL